MNRRALILGLAATPFAPKVAEALPVVFETPFVPLAYFAGYWTRSTVAETIRFTPPSEAFDEALDGSGWTVTYSDEQVGWTRHITKSL